MIFKVPWSLLSKRLVHFFGPFFNIYKELSFTTFEQFSKCSLRAICGKRITASAHMDLVSKYVI